ncbi:RICIN domain-containing protein [Amycolatopsis sp. NPDC026612]|uniref:RICIN domain-containing protein n=1 Tax=Amycolatopsis sp. NPDC026612 TaxID=3155466 RepID=UPI0033C80638
MLQLPRAILVPLVIAVVALTGAAPAYADRTVMPPVSGEVLAWQPLSSSPPTGLKCMQVDKERYDDAAPVDQFTCEYKNNQRWRMGQATDDPNVFWLQNVATAKCLDDSGYGMNQGNPIIQYNCLVGTNQQWRMIWDYYYGDAQFQNVNSGLCLSVDGITTTNYRRLVQNPCYGFVNERFQPILPN